MREITPAVARVHAKLLAVTLFHSSSECVTWDRKLCELVLSSLIHRIRTQDHCNFSITSPPVSPPLQLLSLVRVADTEPQASGGGYGFIFTGFHSRKAECLVSWYAPFYPLHRPESFPERKFNLFPPGSHRAAKFHRDNWQSTVISFSMSSHETNPKKRVYPDMCFIISVAPDHEHATADCSAIPTGI